MNIQELLLKADIKKLKKTYQTIFSDEFFSADPEILNGAISDILGLIPDTSGKDSVLTVLQPYDIDGENDYNPIKDSWDIFFTKKDDKSNYSLMFVDWKTISAMKLNPFMLTVTDPETILAVILFEMTWTGFTYKTAMGNAESKIQELTEMADEAENGNAVSLEELSEELFGKDTRTQEEKDKKEALMRAGLKKAMALNKELYKAYGL